MATGKYGGGSVWFKANGINMLGHDYKTLRHKVTSELEDTTALGDTWREFLPVGISRAEFSVGGGLFDTTATTGSHAVLNAGVATSPQATPLVMCFGLSGDTLGEDFFAYEGALQSSYDAQAEIGALTKANAEYNITGRFERGQIIQPTATKTADWNTDTLNTELDNTLVTSQRVIPITSNSIANPTVVTTTVPHGLTTGDIVFISGVATSSPTINGERTVTVTSTTTFTVPVNVTVGGTGGSFVKSDSTGGAVGFQQTTAFTGFSNVAVKVRDSADNVTYADLITFAGITAVGAERVTTTGTIDRYLIVDGVKTGSGSITIWVGLARLGQQ